MAADPDFGKMPLTEISITERTRSKLAPTITVDPLVTPESEEKSKSGKKVKKKEDSKSPSNAENRLATLKHKPSSSLGIPSHSSLLCQPRFAQGCPS